LGQDSRVRWLTRLGGYGAMGVVFVLLGLGIFGILAQSPDINFITGKKATGTQVGKSVTFTVHGINHVIHSAGTGSPIGKPVTVYYDPGNPDSAIVDSAWEWGPDLALIGVPLLIAAAFFILGGTRAMRVEERRDAARLEAEGDYGWGLDPEFVQRRLDRLRGRD
jgi:Protein of unknown function (DUF3592)